jgi:hypothetical protein
MNAQKEGGKKTMNRETNKAQEFLEQFNPSYDLNEEDLADLPASPLHEVSPSNTLTPEGQPPLTFYFNTPEAPSVPEDALTIINSTPARGPDSREGAGRLQPRRL